MSILGNAEPQIINGATVIDVDHALVKDEPIEDTIIHTSDVTGKRNFINRGDYITFDVTVHLFKYSNRNAKYLELKSLEGTKVIFKPYRDGATIKNVSGEDVLFYVTEVTPFYLNRTDFKDYLKMKFKSAEHISFVDNQGYGFLYSSDYGDRL